MRLGTRVARLERERGKTGCSLCGGQQGLRFVLDIDEQAPEPQACAGCGRDVIVIRIGAAGVRERLHPDSLPA